MRQIVDMQGITGILPLTKHQVYKKLRDPIFPIPHRKCGKKIMFDVEKVLIGKTVHATNNEGATAAYSFAYGKNMMLCYAPPSPGLLVPTAGYIFEWNGFNGLGYDVAISDFEMTEKKAVRIEGEMAYDAKLVCNDLGVFYNGVIS